MSDMMPPQRSRWVLLVPIVIFTALALLFLSQMGKNPQKLPSTLLNKPAPALVLPELAGSGKPPIAEGALKGQVSLVNVFASWCGPCLQEHPQLMALAGDRRIRVIGLNYKDKNDNALAFLGKNGNPYALIGVDPSGRSVIDWGVYGIPESFIINAQGVISYKFVGPITEEALESVVKPEIEKALKAP